MARAPDFDEDKLGGSLLDYWPAIYGECPPEMDDKGYGRRLRDWAEGRPGHRAGSGVSPARWPPSPVSALSVSKGGAAEGGGAGRGPEGRSFNRRRPAAWRRGFRWPDIPGVSLCRRTV